MTQDIAIEKKPSMVSGNGRAEVDAPGRLCVTRALKNARQLRETAPQIFPPGQSVTGVIPLDTLARIHLAPRPADLVQEGASRDALAQLAFPAVTTSAVDPLFDGALQFVDIRFTLNNDPAQVLQVSDADMRTAVDFARLAAPVISEYASQYGPNAITVTPGILSYSVTLAGTTYNDAELQGWINDIASKNGVPTSACIVVLNPQGVINTDADPGAGIGGYHGHANLAYAFVNLMGTGLTVSDTAQLYALALAHELAEMTVDPMANLVNPEVCDPCGPNCQNVFVDYFELDGTYIQTVQATGYPPAPPPFSYAFFINGIVQPASATSCPAPASSCNYAPPVATGTQHVNYTGDDNHVHELWWDNSGWHHNDLTAAAAAPLAAADSDLDGYVLGDGTQHVNYCGDDNHVHELWWDASGWHPNDLTAAAGAPVAAAGSHLDGYVQGETQHLNYCGDDNHVHELWWDTGGWHHNDLTAAAGAPLAAPGSDLDGYTLGDGTQHVNFCGDDDHVHELWWDASGWHHNDLTAAAGAPLAVTASGLDGYVLGDCTQHVNYCGADSHIHELWWDTATWHHNDLTAAAGAPLAAIGGEIDGYVMGGTQHVNFRGDDNHVHELWWDTGGWHHNDLTGAAGAPLVAAGSDLDGYVMGGTQHVNFRGDDNHVHELWWDTGGWHHNDLTAAAGAPLAAPVGHIDGYAMLALTQIEFVIGTGGDDLGGGQNGSSATADVLLRGGGSFTVALRDQNDPHWDNWTSHTVVAGIPPNLSLTASQGIAGVRLNLVQNNPSWAADNWDVASLGVSLFNPVGARVCQLNLTGSATLQDGSKGLVRLSQSAGSSGVGPQSQVFATGPGSGCP